MTSTPTDPKKQPLPFYKTRAFKSRVIVYGILIIMAWILLPKWVHNMTYPIPTEAVPSPPPQPIHEIQLTTRNQEKLVAWFLPTPHENAPLLIFFHGNGQNLATMLYSGFLHRFPSMGVHLLVMDYPGYGNSEGAPSEATLLEAGELTMEWALTQYPDAPKIIMGWSLGAAVAIQTSQSFSGHHDGLILLSAWTQIADVAKDHFPNWMVYLLMKEKYDSQGAAPHIKVPTLVFHGKEDDIINNRQGRTIAQIIGEKNTCQWVLLDNIGHNDIMNAALTWTHISHFFEQIKKGTTRPHD